MPRYLHLFILPAISFNLALSAKDNEEFIDPNVIEMSPFVVYGGLIDTIDGFTEQEYHEDDPVVLGFREDFNNILLGFHKKLLITEYQHMTSTLELEKACRESLIALGQWFGVKELEPRKNLFHREKAITNRLVKDPFFLIDALIVWDADRLARYKGRRPHSKYAVDIRYNTETEGWERRIITRWDVKFMQKRGYFTTFKEQGLNLDTNRGFHLIKKGLPGDIRPEAFKKVRLTYPIFVNSFEPAEIQIERLQTQLIKNLFYIYDPYSWIARRGERFRLHDNFTRSLRQELEYAKLPVTDEDWFLPVLTDFLIDIVIMKHQGVKEVYDHEMLKKFPIRKNLLGIGFDLLNWNDGEERSIRYDPYRSSRVSVNFNNPNGARWVMIDAYRRYGMRVLHLLSDEIQLLKAEKREMSGKELIKKVLAQVTQTSADTYIRLAEKAQVKELEKHKYKLE